MIYVTKNPVQLSLVIFLLSAIISGCSSTPVNNSLLAKTTDIVTNKPVVDEMQVDLFSKKLIASDYTWMGLNDIKTVKTVLEYNAKETLHASFVQCIYENIDRGSYKKESREVAGYLIKNYPSEISSFSYKLDSLNPIVTKIFQHPTPVTFNTSNLLNSSALQILPRSEAIMMSDLMKDKKYRPLLAVIGLPVMGDNKVVEDFSVGQIGSMMDIILEARPKCIKIR